jgi:hypothetical protein
MSEVHEKLLAQQAQLQPGAREKFWHERDKDEKLEALRHSIVGLHHIIAMQREQIEALLAHGHAADGRVMRPLQDGRNSANGDGWIPTGLRAESDGRQYGR